MTKCPQCNYPNRVRLGAQLNELERITCHHFVRYEYRKEAGAVYFTFAFEELETKCA